MCHLAQSPRSWGQGFVPRPGGSEVLAGVPLPIMSAWHWANCLWSWWPNSSGVKWGLCSSLCQSWLLWLLTPLRKPASAAVFQELKERKDLTSSGVFWHLHNIIIKLLVIFSACALLNYFFFLFFLFKYTSSYTQGKVSEWPLWIQWSLCVEGISWNSVAMWK